MGLTAVGSYNGKNDHLKTVTVIRCTTLKAAESREGLLNDTLQEPFLSEPVSLRCA
jgi:hypothetical protein